MLHYQPGDPKKSEISDIPDSDFRIPERLESAKSMREFPNSKISHVGNSGFALTQSRFLEIPEVPGCGLESDVHSIRGRKVRIPRFLSQLIGIPTFQSKVPEFRVLSRRFFGIPNS